MIRTIALGLLLAGLATYAVGSQPGSAQTPACATQGAVSDPITFVSNTGQTVESGGTRSFAAQSFVTGAECRGYIVSEIQILLLGSASAASTRIKLREDDGGEPGNLVAEFTNPDTLASDSLNTFTAPAGTTLVANTTYWITASEGVAVNRPVVAQTHSDVETGETGWSIGDRRLWRSSETNDWSTSQTSLVIAINGTTGGTTTTDAILSGLALEDGDGNREAPPLLSIVADPALIAEEDDSETTGVAENVSTLIVSIENDKTSATDQTITLTFGGSPVYGTHYSVSPDDADDAAMGHQVVLPAGTASVEVTVTAAANDTVDGNRDIIVTGSGLGAHFGTVIVLLDDDTTNTATTPGITVSKSALTVTEEDTTGDSYMVVLDSQPTADVTVAVAGHSGRTVTPSPTTLTFTTSNWNTPRTVTVTSGDDADTRNHLISLTHSATSTDGGYSGIGIADVTVTVNDNDTAQVTWVTVAAGNARLVVSWTAVDNATGYTVQWKSGGENYDANRQATVTRGSTTRHTIRNLTNGTDYTVRVIATRTNANDGPPSEEAPGMPVADPPTDPEPLTLTVEAEREAVTEGEPVRYRIVMSRPTPGGVLVEAVYRYVGEFVRNNPSRTGTGIRSHRGVLYWEVERETLDDVVYEADGAFTVQLQRGAGYTLGTPSSVTVRILDNDREEPGPVSPPLVSPPLVSPPLVSVANATVREGPDAMLAFTVTLDQPFRETATVDWETLNGSGKAGAKAGQDYVAASGTLVFTPGETVKTVNVAVLDDDVVEGRETMVLYLPHAVGAIIADAVAKGIIEN